MTRIAAAEIRNGRNGVAEFTAAEERTTMMKMRQIRRDERAAGYMSPNPSQPPSLLFVRQAASRGDATRKMSVVGALYTRYRYVMISVVFERQVASDMFGA